MAKLQGMFNDRDEGGGEEMTPERRLALWEQLQRIKTVEEFEKMLVEAAKNQAAWQGGVVIV